MTGSRMEKPDSVLSRRHLLAVWNPVVGADVMEQHLRMLQDAARKFRHKKARADEVYVWWGKSCARRTGCSRYPTWTRSWASRPRRRSRAQIRCGNVRAQHIHLHVWNKCVCSTSGSVTRGDT
jgi:hypothetical protein